MKVRQVDRNDPGIDPFRSLQASGARLAKGGQIIVEGIQAIHCLIASGARIRTLLLEEKYLSELAAELEQREGECLIASLEVISEIVGYRLHRGLMALAERPPLTELPNLAFPAVALDGLSDAENVGAIVRTAYAFGVRSIVLDSTSCDPYVRRAIRVSMGSVVLCSVCRVEKLSVALMTLRQRARIIAVERSPESVPLDSTPVSQNSVWVFGSEIFGIQPEVLALSHAVAHIPMVSGPLRSLNVAAAAAIVLSRYYSASTFSVPVPSPN